MNQFLNALAMGGYCAYVWSAYGLASLVFGLLFVSSRVQKKRTHRQLKQWFNH